MKYENKKDVEPRMKYENKKDVEPRMKYENKKDVDPNENWERNWKEILENPDGSINVEQLKLELCDFTDFIDRMTKITSKLTNGRLSYPTYPVDVILDTAYEVYEDNFGCPVCGTEHNGDPGENLV